MKLKFIVMATLLFFIVPKADAQSYTCTSSINVASGAAITVGANQTVCLTATSGTYTPSSITIAATGILVVKSGVTLNFTGWPTNFSGKIINLGTLNLGGNFNSGTIENYGHTTINQMQQSTSSNPVTLTNNGQLEIDGYWALYNASINNQSGNIIFNSASTLYNTTIDNSGYMEFVNGINNTYNSTFNNYGYFEVGAQMQFNDGTYLSNDSTMSFGGKVNFQGALFTNNGRIMVNGGNDFALDKATNGIANNGIWVVSGKITFGASITLTNNCRIVANGVFQMNTLDTLYNNGLLWLTGSTSKFYISTGGSTIKNGANGFVRGKDFSINNGVTIGGQGTFYFTGTATNGGSIIGSSATNKIKFYTSSGNPIGGTTSNVTFLATSSIGTSLKDTTNYDCGGNPVTVVGNPPFVKGDTVSLCSAAPVTFQLITQGLITPYNNTYTISWSTLKLFSVGGTENTTSLTTAQGTWVADTTNKKIVFTPKTSFTNGTAKAQFKVADKKAGDPTTYPSNKATLVIKITPVMAPTDLNVEGY